MVYIMYDEAIRSEEKMMKQFDFQEASERMGLFALRGLVAKRDGFKYVDSFESMFGNLYVVALKGKTFYLLGDVTNWEKWEAKVSLSQEKGFHVEFDFVLNYDKAMEGDIPLYISQIVKDNFSKVLDVGE